MSEQQELIGRDSNRITRDEVIEELKRELIVRRQVYGKWVKSGKIEGHVATHRYRCIEQAIRLLSNE